MGLDVYAGPLCRYYAGDWKLITQQAAEARGENFQIIRTDGHLPFTSSADAQSAVLNWRSALQDVAGDGLPPLKWAESPTADYFTDKPDWDGYLSLRLLAGRLEFPDAAPPSQLDSQPTKSPLWARIEEVYHGRRSLISRLLRRGGSNAPDALRFPHLHVPEMWLPIDVEAPFRATEPLGSQMTFGSLPRLLQELEALNEQTVRLADARREQASKVGPPEDRRDWQAAAAFGLAIFLQAARYGVAHELPMKLDY